jgi:transposase
MCATPLRKSYPSDISDEEWSLVVPYLTLMTEAAPQRDHALRRQIEALQPRRPGTGARAGLGAVGLLPRANTLATVEGRGNSAAACAASANGPRADAKRIEQTVRRAERLRHGPSRGCARRDLGPP